MAGCDFVDWYMIVEHKVQHVEGRVPAGRDILQHHLNLEAEFFKLCQPLRENDCR